MGNTEELPLCFDDRQTFSELDQYMFVSYSHLDSAAVYEDLRGLYEGCLNFWYDKKLRLGDRWDESVQTKINAENCVGILLFLSPNTVKSEAVEKELKLYTEIKKRKKNFKLIPIALGGKSVNATVRDAYLSCADLTDGELGRRLPQERVVNVFTVVPDAALYVARKEDGAHIATLLEELKKYEQETEDGRLFCSSEAVLERIARLPLAKVKEGKTLLTLGTYPQEMYENPPYFLTEGTQTVRGETITVHRGKAYLHTPVNWIVVRSDDETVTAVTELSVDCCTSEELLNCAEKFRSTAFPEPEIVRAVKVADTALLTEFMEQLMPLRHSAFAQRFGNLQFLPTYWGFEGSKKVEFYYDKSKIKVLGASSKDRLAAVRLVAEFDVKKITEQYQG